MRNRQAKKRLNRAFYLAILRPVYKTVLKQKRRTAYVKSEIMEIIFKLNNYFKTK